MKYAQLKWAANTGTPGVTFIEGTVVRVITEGRERSLVDDENGVRAWVDAGDITPHPMPKTRWDRLTGPDDV